MQTQKEQCEVFAYFYSKCAELGLEVARKLVQFRIVGDSSWFPFINSFCQLPHPASEYRIDPFYKDWKFELFTLKASIKVGDDGNVSSADVSECTNENVMLDFDLFGVEALDNMGLFSDGVIEGDFEVSGVIEIGPGVDEVHYTCTHKQL